MGIERFPENYIYSDGCWWVVQRLPFGVFVHSRFFTSMEACRNHFAGEEMAGLLDLYDEAFPDATSS